MAGHWVQMAGLAGALALVSGGCPGEWSGWFSDTVTVEIYNNTDFDVDPIIRFDDDSNFLAGWFPAEELATGLLAPGEDVLYEFDCDELGLIFSDDARQYLLGVEIGQADSSRTLTRDNEYDCGADLLFEFIGNGADFGVIVSRNGVVID